MPPIADLLVVGASSVVTAGGPARARRGKELRRLGVVRNGGLAVHGGRILEVGPSRRLRARYRAKKTLDVDGRVVLPGFVDAHTHLPFAGSRAFELELKLAGKSYLEILAAGGGIHRTVRDTRRASIPELVNLVDQRLRVMSSWGTTTAEAKSGYGLRLRDELKQLRAVDRSNGRHGVELVPTFLGAHVVPREYRKRRRAYVDLLVERMIPLVARSRLAEYCDAFLEEGAFSREECRRILEAATRHGLKTKLHADEFTNQKGAELAAALSCASAEHLLHVSSKGVRALARSGTIAVLLPAVSVTSLVGRFAPGRALVDAGAAVALGTDFNPNCHVLAMPTVIQWACYHLRLTPAEAFLAATVNSAYAVGRGERVGSLEKGKQADFVVLDSDDPLDLVYRVGVNPVWAVAKAGRVRKI